MGLRSKTIFGVGIVGGLQLFRSVLSGIVTILLYRLLAARDFGIFSLCDSYVMLFAVFADMGMETVAVQRKEKDFSAVLHAAFLMKLCCTLLCLVFIFLGADFLGRMEHHAEAAAALRILSLTLLVSLSYFKAEALLKRGIHFGKLVGPEMATGISAAVFSIVFALLHFGYWSLILSTILSLLIRSIYLNWIFPESHRGRWDALLIRSLWTDGKHVFLITLLFYVLARASYFFVGSFLGLTVLGYFNLAFSYSNLFVTRIVQVASRVVFPAAASVASEPARIRKIYYEFLEKISLAGAPFHAAIAILAPLLVPLIVGEKWRPAVPALQVLCLHGYFRSLSSAGFTVLQSVGEFRSISRYTSLEIAAIFLLIYPALKWGGLSGVVFLLAVSKIFGWYLVTTRMKTLLKDSWILTSRSVFPAAVSSLIMMGFMWLCLLVLPASVTSLFRIIIASVVGVIVYFVFYLLIHHDRPSQIRGILEDISSLLRNFQ